MRRRGWSTTFAVTSAVASAYLGIVSYFPRLASDVTVLVAAALVLIAALGLIALPLQDNRTERARRDAVDAVRDALNTACVTFGRITSTPVEQFSATLLVARSTRTGEELVGVVSGGLAHHPPTEIAWRPGIGVVGLCWRSHVSQFRDLNPLIASAVVSTEQSWNARGPDETMGLTHDEWQRTRTSFGTIVVACVYPQHRVAGVVSIDAPPGVDVSGFETELLQTAEAVAWTLKDLVK